MKFYSKILSNVGDEDISFNDIKIIEDAIDNDIDENNSIDGNEIEDSEDYDQTNVDHYIDNSLIDTLQLALVGEYQQWDLYVSYASRLKGCARNPVADEFKTHANEELEHIETLQSYLVSMGENPTLQRKSSPELNNATMLDIINLQIKYEKDAVDLYQKILPLLSNNDSLRIEIENILIKEQEHVHDLELLISNNEVSAYFIPMEAGEITKPQAGYSTNYKLSKSDIDWCTRALKELTPDIYAKLYQGKLLTLADKALVVRAISLKWGIKDRRTMLRFLDCCAA